MPRRQKPPYESTSPKLYRVQTIRRHLLTRLAASVTTREPVIGAIAGVFTAAVAGGLSRAVHAKASPELPAIVRSASIPKANRNRAEPAFAPVEPDYRMGFPRDHGAHPNFRTEWWYLTAWLQTAHGPAGLQLTFFRSRTAHARNNPSRFAARQLMFAHAALAWPAHGRLMHDQLAARARDDMYSLTDTNLQMGRHSQRWQLRRSPTDSYEARLDTPQFSLHAQLAAPGAPVLQGQAGYSRKGPQPEQASYYYSRPGLKLSGSLKIHEQRIRRDTMRISGTGWLDHEWSSELLDEQATGWDWIGINLNNGDALIAFRIRRADHTTIWSHARWIRNNLPGPASEPIFIVQRQWRSPRTGTLYPVQLNVTIDALTIALAPLLDDQELDSRSSTGTLYWEGAVRALDTNGRQIGLGYLELTGYNGRVRF